MRFCRSRRGWERGGEKGEFVVVFLVRVFEFPFFYTIFFFSLSFSSFTLRADRSCWEISQDLPTNSDGEGAILPVSPFDYRHLSAQV
jgi:hypothetical protein